MPAISRAGMSLFSQYDRSMIDTPPAQVDLKTDLVSGTDKEQPCIASARPPIWRSLILGAFLVPLNVVWTTAVEVRWYTLDGTSLPLFITPVFLLFVLTLANFAIGRLSPKARLRQYELLLVYIMLVTSCSFAGQDTLQNLFGFIGHAYWNANPSNNWQRLFFHFLPSFLVVTDKDALAGYYQGNVSIYGANGRHYLMSWIVPLAIWGFFFLTLVGMYLCMVILVRRQWIESEKLTFPIVQLPIAMTADDAGVSFFKNPRMWVGFGVAACVSFFNGLHVLYPSVPQLNVKLYDLHNVAVLPPWNAIGQTTSSFYPFAIGLAYFMPVHLSFSCWFFFLVSRLMRVAGAAYGLNDPSGAGYPGLGQQATGAWVGIGVMLLYSARGYFADVLRSAWQGTRSVKPREAAEYRWALIGLLTGTVLIGIFCAVIGMSLLAAVLFFGMVFRYTRLPPQRKINDFISHATNIGIQK